MTGGQVAGSFRDKAGHVYFAGDRILRSVKKGDGQARFRSALQSGLLDRLVEMGWLVGFNECDMPSELGEVPGVSTWLEHPRLPFLSQPYEWPFSLWKRAALHQLDVHLEVLRHNHTLIDATAYNIQFVGVSPILIDHLSIAPYQEGAPWIGQHQFCCEFLNPLLLWSKCGVAPNDWVRGSLDGIRPEELLPLLPLSAQFSPTVLAHVRALAHFARRNRRQLETVGRTPTGLARSRLTAMLESLRNAITKLSLKERPTTWEDYATNTSYSDDDASLKRNFVGRFCQRKEPDLLIDLGCNSGDYSLLALEAGAKRVVGFDFDHGALEQAVARADQQAANFTPLWLDASNPSPNQGWRQKEREGFSERASGDAVFALALVHHLAIAKNIPLGEVIDWIMGIAPAGVIEFPTKEDAMVQLLLSQRDDIFADYSVERFRQEVGKRSTIISDEELAGGNRLLIAFERQ